MCLFSAFYIAVGLVKERIEIFLLALLWEKKERLYLQSLLRNGFQEESSKKVL